MTDKTVSQRLEQLLGFEREALLSGDFERIEQLISEKQALVEELRESPEEVPAVAPLRAGLRRNHELFDHALAGIRNVAARLGDLNRARKSVYTYDSMGRKQSIDTPKTKRLERRA